MRHEGMYYWLQERQINVRPDGTLDHILLTRMSCKQGGLAYTLGTIGIH